MQCHVLVRLSALRAPLTKPSAFTEKTEDREYLNRSSVSSAWGGGRGRRYSLYIGISHGKV